MSESASTTSSIPAESFAPRDHTQPPESLVARYRLDHRNPVNHFLHVGVGWPMVAISILVLPFRPLWSAVLFLSAYAIMFFGHFVFERNVPTILKEPGTPFVMAGAVIRDLWAALARLVRPRRVR
jgi:hypothetical protein